MERKDYLVCLKGNQKGFTTESGTDFNPHKAYRFIKNGKWNLVNGEPLSDKVFNTLFEFVLDRAKRHFELLGLTKNGNPISKTKFKELADIHQYGRGKEMLNVIYFNGFHNDKIIYGFYPLCKGDSKAICLTNAHQMYLQFLNGDSDDFDCEDIQFGNTGIPIGYGDLRQRYIKETSFNDIL